MFAQIQTPSGAFAPKKQLLLAGFGRSQMHNFVFTNRSPGGFRRPPRGSGPKSSICSTLHARAQNDRSTSCLLPAPAEHHKMESAREFLNAPLADPRHATPAIEALRAASIASALRRMREEVTPSPQGPRILSREPGCLSARGQRSRQKPKRPWPFKQVGQIGPRLHRAQGASVGVWPKHRQYHWWGRRRETEKEARYALRESR